MLAGAEDPLESVREMRAPAGPPRRLTPYKRPKDVVLVDALPRNALGKVTKQVLRERYG